MSTKTDILSPVGRLVQGSAFEANTTDAQGAPLRDKMGNPKVNYFLALAVPKESPDWPAFKAQLDAVAAQAFPHHWTLPTFSSKVIDGDSAQPDQNNVRPCDKDGFPGHWIVRFSSGFAPTVYSRGGTAVITDPAQVKRGYYVRVYGSTSGNGNAQKPGIYVNLNMVELIGYGEEITSGPSGLAVFGAAANTGYMPPGMTSAPVAPAVPLAPQAATAPPAAYAPPVATAPPAAYAPPVATAPPVAQVQPAPDFLNPAPQAEQLYFIQGTGYTRASLLAGGWTNDAIDKLAVDNDIPF